MLTSAFNAVTIQHTKTHNTGTGDITAIINFLVLLFISSWSWYWCGRLLNFEGFKSCPKS